MKNAAIKKITINLTTSLQVLLIIIPIVLQYLSDKKMGVNRYLVFKKMIFSNDIFTSRLVFMFKIILILGVIIGIAVLTVYSIKVINSALVKPIIKVSILNLIAINFVFSKQFENSLTYHFFLIAFFGIISLQYIKVFVSMSDATRKKYS